MGFPCGSAGKESTCNARDPGSIPGLRIHWRRNRVPNPVFLGFPGGSAGKESACNVGDLGLIPELERSPGEGKSYPLQYSGLGNFMDCIVHREAKSRAGLSDCRFHFHSAQFSSVTQSCPTLCDPMDYTTHGILQARILEWVAFPFSRESSQPRDQTRVSCTAGRFLMHEPPGKALHTHLQAQLK